MFNRIRPLFPYMRRYKRDFFWGGLSIILSNAIAVLFPLVVALVIDGLNTGVTRRKVLIYSGMLARRHRRQRHLPLSLPPHPHRHLARYRVRPA